ncbi:hypothetical protein L1887_48293 [Cichorium endivia]|nr:hypothetical protein L1887_48293 [Cichorium endivia]
MMSILLAAQDLHRSARSAAASTDDPSRGSNGPTSQPDATPNHASQMVERWREWLEELNRWRLLTSQHSDLSDSSLESVDLSLLYHLSRTFLGITSAGPRRGHLGRNTACAQGRLQLESAQLFAARRRPAAHHLDRKALGSLCAQARHHRVWRKAVVSSAVLPLAARPRGRPAPHAFEQSFHRGGIKRSASGADLRGDDPDSRGDGQHDSTRARHNNPGNDAGSVQDGASDPLNFQWPFMSGFPTSASAASAATGSIPHCFTQPHPAAAIYPWESRRKASGACQRPGPLARALPRQDASPVSQRADLMRSEQSPTWMWGHGLDAWPTLQATGHFCDRLRPLDLASARYNKGDGDDPAERARIEAVDNLLHGDDAAFDVLAGLRETWVFEAGPRQRPKAVELDGWERTRPLIPAFLRDFVVPYQRRHPFALKLNADGFPTLMLPATTSSPSSTTGRIEQSTAATARTGPRPRPTATATTRSLAPAWARLRVAAFVLMTAAETLPCGDRDRVDPFDGRSLPYPWSGQPLFSAPDDAHRPHRPWAALPPRLRHRLPAVRRRLEAAQAQTRAWSCGRATGMTSRFRFQHPRRHPPVDARPLASVLRILADASLVPPSEGLLDGDLDLDLDSLYERFHARMELWKSNWMTSRFRFKHPRRHPPVDARPLASVAAHPRRRQPRPSERRPPRRRPRPRPRPRLALRTLPRQRPLEAGARLVVPLAVFYSQFRIDSVCVSTMCKGRFVAKRASGLAGLWVDGVRELLISDLEALREAVRCQVALDGRDGTEVGCSKSSEAILLARGIDAGHFRLPHLPLQPPPMGEHSDQLALVGRRYSADCPRRKRTAPDLRAPGRSSARRRALVGRDGTEVWCAKSSEAILLAKRRPSHTQHAKANSLLEKATAASLSPGSAHESSPLLRAGEEDDELDPRENHGRVAVARPPPHDRGPFLRAKRTTNSLLEKATTRVAVARLRPRSSPILRASEEDDTQVDATPVAIIDGSIVEIEHELSLTARVKDEEEDGNSLFDEAVGVNAGDSAHGRADRLDDDEEDIVKDQQDYLGDIEDPNASYDSEEEEKACCAMASSATITTTRTTITSSFSLTNTRRGRRE